MQSKLVEFETGILRSLGSGETSHPATAVFNLYKRAQELFKDTTYAFIVPLTDHSELQLSKTDQQALFVRLTIQNTTGEHISYRYHLTENELKPEDKPDNGGIGDDAMKIFEEAFIRANEILHPPEEK